MTAPDAKTLVNQVADGDLDAAIVYRSDAVRAVTDGRISIVRISGGDHGTTDYRLVIVHPGEAVDAFVRYIRRSKIAADVLKRAGLVPLARHRPHPGRDDRGHAAAGLTATRLAAELKTADVAWVKQGPSV